ncbi:MAG: nickel/cobalt ABC transporter permease [Pseudomonadota bacterium]
MNTYILKRIAGVIPLLFAISIFTFVFVNLIPVDPAEVILRVWNIPVASPELIAETRESLGLNDPYIVRYCKWLMNAVQLDFGISYTNPDHTVIQEIANGLPNTLTLASVSFLFVVLISLPVGFLCAVYKDSWFDKLMRAFVFLTTAMPAYWIGLILMWVFAVKLHWFPTSGNYHGMKSIVLPAITVASSYISIFIRLVRNNMIENMKEDYVLYANVRGLKQRSILIKHILKNSLQTCVVAVGMSIPQLIAGTIVVENVFAWPGLGTLCIQAVFTRDMPVIQAYVLLVGALFVIFNLTFDIIQGLMDPKLRVGAKDNA